MEAVLGIAMNLIIKIKIFRINVLTSLAKDLVVVQGTSYRGPG